MSAKECEDHINTVIFHIFQLNAGNYFIFPPSDPPSGFCIKMWDYTVQLSELGDDVGGGSDGFFCFAHQQEDKNPISENSSNSSMSRAGKIQLYPCDPHLCLPVFWPGLLQVTGGNRRSPGRRVWKGSRGDKCETKLDPERDLVQFSLKTDEMRVITRKTHYRVLRYALTGFHWEEKDPFGCHGEGSRAATNPDNYS